MKILVIEDSVRLRNSIGTALRKSGYVVDCAADGEEGLWMAETGQYDAVILDLMLPKMDGLTLLRQLRSRGNETHVLILTAMGTVDDRVTGLKGGADDYLVKPFSIDELLARVGVLVRRSYSQKAPRKTIGNLLLDLNQREFCVNNVPLALAPREYRILEFLFLKEGQVAGRGDIEAHLYEETAEIFSNAVDSAISLLRRKLAEAGSEVGIATRRGQGYVLILGKE